MYLFNLVSVIVLGLFTAVLGWQSLGVGGEAGVYPLILVVLTLVFLVGIALHEAMDRASVPRPTGQLAALVAARGKVLARLLGFLVLWLLYPVLMVQLGFLVSTFAIVTLSLWAVVNPLTARFALGAAVTAAVLAGVFAVLMSTVLYIPTPSGPLDDALTGLIYTLQN